MEVIKKRICLEDFISRIPALIETISDNNSNNKGSWGKIPNSVIVLGKNMKYGTFMNLYYNLLNVIMYSVYYEYDLSRNKFILKDYDWRDSFKDKDNILYTNTLPTSDIKDKLIVGITSNEGLYHFYDEVKTLTNNSYSGFDIVQDINNIIGKKIVPYTYKCSDCGYSTMTDSITICPKCKKNNITIIQEPKVPYFLYLSDVDDLILELENLKDIASKICCEKRRYEEHGGDAFLEYLKKLKEDGWEVYKNINGYVPTIDIPILLTSDITDLGQYKTYNVDEVDENGNTLNNIKDEKESTELVFTSGESKLKTLRKRRRSVDDNGIELPGILNLEEKILESPYQIGYIKNIQIVDNVFYGDMIVSINENVTSVEQTEDYYETLKSSLKAENYNEGTTTEPLKDINEGDVLQTEITFGDLSKTYTDVMNYYSNDVLNREISLRNKMLGILNKGYPNILCLKQDYSFTYNLSYGEEDIDNAYEDEYGVIKIPISKVDITETKTGSIYVVFDSVQGEFTYVIGGKLKENDGKLQLDEDNPFNLSELEYSDWTGSGIWYKEEFPIRKLCIDEYVINDTKMQFTYDVIDFESKEETYEYEGIDFPRKNYILCENIIYKPETYRNYSTNDPIFKDEKMMGINLPLKEDYNVSIDRGISAAFEKHLQLSELKTWDDLENYRNGMFLNK